MRPVAAGELQVAPIIVEEVSAERTPPQLGGCGSRRQCGCARAGRARTAN